MSRSINNYYDLYQYIVRKQRGVMITPAQFTANLDAGQLDAFNEYFRPNGDTPTQELHDALRPFVKTYQFTSDSGGLVNFPSDYHELTGKVYTVTGSTVNEITIHQKRHFVRALTSQLRPVSNTDPMAEDVDAGFRIYPQQVQIGFFDYLKRPATPVYGYSQVGRAITYNPNTSTQLEWNEAYINNIMAKALIYAGVNMGEADVYKFANEYNAQTQ